MTYAATPSCLLTDDEIRRYREDGVEKARAAMSIQGRFMSRKTRGYQVDTFPWKHVDEIRDAVYYGPFAHWARQFMGFQTWNAA